MMRSTIAPLVTALGLSLAAGACRVLHRHDKRRTETAVTASRTWLALASALLCQAASAGNTIQAVAATPDPDFPEFAERMAFIATADDGKQQLSARLVSKVGFTGKEFSVQPGDRLLGDVTVDGAAIWGSGGVHVDVMISGLVKPGSILVLLDDLRVVEIQGIWGSGGVHIDNVVIHGPVWDTAVCGPATTFAETLREVANPDESFDDPILAIGTEGGCVGFAGYANPHQVDPVQFPDPNDWYPDPQEWLPLTLQATGDPLIAIGGIKGESVPVDDLASTRISDDWGVIPGGFEPSFDNWLAPSDAFPDPADWFPGDEWFPGSEWYPDPLEWFPGSEWLELTATAGGQAFGVFPGTRPLGEIAGAPPYSTFLLDGSGLPAPLTSLATPGFAIDAEPAITTGNEVLMETRLAGADGTASVSVASLNPSSVQWGTAIPVDTMSTAPTLFPVTKLTLASLWAVSGDGQRVLYDPTFDLNADPPTALADQYTLGGVLSADLGPHAYQRSSSGNFVTATLEAGGGSAADIVAHSLALTVEGDPGDPLAPVRTTLDDDDGDGNDELIAKFDRATFHERIASFPDGAEVRLELTWDYADECDVDVPCRGGYTQVVKIVP